MAVDGSMGATRRQDTPRMANTLTKAERLSRRKVIEKVFAGGARSFAFFPLRVAYMPVEEAQAPVSVLVSVPKRRLKLAVSRNRAKRQIREAYRLNKRRLVETARERGLRLAVAFIYIADAPVPTARMAESMGRALDRIADDICTRSPGPPAQTPPGP